MYILMTIHREDTEKPTAMETVKENKTDCSIKIFHVDIWEEYSDPEACSTEL